MINLKANLQTLVIDVPWGQKRVRDSFTSLVAMLVDYHKTVAGHRNVNDYEMRFEYDKL
jgi:hypothetical protein